MTSMTTTRAFGTLALAGVLALSTTACSAPLEWLGVRLYSDRVDLPAGQVHEDLAYWDGPEAHPEKHRLDLFTPAGEGWPVMIFVHGGGWTGGDKDYEAGGVDIYGNLGRFYASKGIGTAVISYRLQPECTWRDQVEDVARATAWVYRHAADYGGDESRLFLSGHSAGAHLAAWVALDEELLGELGLSPEILDGVVAVSGAGYDLADEKTYELGAELEWYEERFRLGPEDESWQKEASVIRHVGPETPPFLLLYSRREWPSLQHQNRLFQKALDGAGVENRRVEIRGKSHALMVLAMTRADHEVGREILDFLDRGGS